MLEAIDKVAINFDEGQLFMLNLCLAFLMFGIALDLKLSDFRYVLRHPKAVWVGLSSQLIVLPLLTLVLIHITKPTLSIQMGMLMVSVCPGGNVSNYLVHRSRGNTALSITLTSIVTIGAVLITPFSFVLYSRLLPDPAGIKSIDVPLESMIWILIQIILVPLLIGMVIYQRWPWLRDRIVVPVRWFSILLLVGIIVFALSSNVPVIRNHLGTVFLLVLLHNTMALLAGNGLARINKLPEADIRAITMETGIQNSGLGLILIFNYFDGLGGMAVVAAWWGVWHLISGMTVSTWWLYQGKIKSASGVPLK